MHVGEMKEAAEVGKESNDSIVGEHLLAWKTRAAHCNI